MELKIEYYQDVEYNREEALENIFRLSEKPEFIGRGSGGKTYVYHVKLLNNVGLIEEKAAKIISCVSAELDENVASEEIAIMLDELSDIAIRADDDVRQEIQNWQNASTCSYILPLDSGYTLLKWKKEKRIGVDYVLLMPYALCLSKKIYKYREKDFTKPVDENIIINMGIDLCRALENLENLNPPICHRDIKPDNIYWWERKEWYCLGDFGISVEEGKIQHTNTGTMAYWSPEQAFHYPQNERDHRQDIYSLGLVLYELADTQPIMAHYHERLYDKTLPELPKENISSKLNEVIHKACEFEAKNRYQHATEFREALEQVQNSYEECDVEDADKTRVPENNQLSYFVSVEGSESEIKEKALYEKVDKFIGKLNMDKQMSSSFWIDPKNVLCFVMSLLIGFSMILIITVGLNSSIKVFIDQNLKPKKISGSYLLMVAIPIFQSTQTIIFYKKCMAGKGVINKILILINRFNLWVGLSLMAALFKSWNTFSLACVCIFAFAHEVYAIGKPYIPQSEEELMEKIFQILKNGILIKLFIAYIIGFLCQLCCIALIRYSILSYGREDLVKVSIIIAMPLLLQLNDFVICKCLQHFLPSYTEDKVERVDLYGHILGALFFFPLILAVIEQIIFSIIKILGISVNFLQDIFH